MKSLLTILLALQLIIYNQDANADSRRDAQMMALADSAGCAMCHNMKSYKVAPNGLPPIAPSWLEIADQYRKQPHAQENLVAVVMGGSSVYGSHWEDKVSGTVMPPNAIPLKEAEAKQLIAWILSLKPSHEPSRN